MVDRQTEYAKWREKAVNWREKAFVDPLTGLYNRRGFEKTALELIEFARREDFPISVLMLDIDHFKKINDSLGHRIGDKVLQELAYLLSSDRKETKVRKADVVGRWGGEEFVILLPNADLDAAKNVAERIREEIESKSSFTVSIGAAQMEDESFEDLLARADKAMYQAKENGRNRTEVAKAKN